MWSSVSQRTLWVPTVFRSGVPSAHCLSLGPGPGSQGFNPVQSPFVLLLLLYSMWECLSGFQVKLSMFKCFLKYVWSISVREAKSIKIWTYYITSTTSFCKVFFWRQICFPLAMSNPKISDPKSWAWWQAGARRLDFMQVIPEGSDSYGWENIEFWLWNKKNNILFCIKFQWNNICGRVLNCKVPCEL